MCTTGSTNLKQFLNIVHTSTSKAQSGDTYHTTAFLVKLKINVNQHLALAIYIKCVLASVFNAGDEIDDGFMANGRWWAAGMLVA